MCINWKNSSRRGNVIQEVEIKFQKVEDAPENKNVVTSIPYLNYHRHKSGKEYLPSVQKRGQG